MPYKSPSVASNCSLMQVKLNACSSTDRFLHLPSITTLDGSDLEYGDNYRYLGVWLDYKLSSRLILNISNPKLNIESASYYATKPPFLTPPNIPL